MDAIFLLLNYQKKSKQSKKIIIEKKKNDAQWKEKSLDKWAHGYFHCPKTPYGACLITALLSNKKAKKNAKLNFKKNDLIIKAMQPKKI